MNVNILPAVTAKPANSDHVPSKRPQGTQACVGCRDRKSKCDEVRPACGLCIRKNSNCRYAFEAGVKRQHAVEHSLKNDLRRVQSEVDSERQQREVLQEDLRNAERMVQQQRDQHHIQQAQLSEAHTRTADLREYQQPLLEHLQAAQADLVQARSTVEQQRDQYRSLQHEAQVVIESQQDTHRILCKGIEDAQSNLLKIASLLNSFRSQPELQAEFLLKTLRQGHYDWALIETLDWREYSSATKPYPWHDWRSVDEYMTSDPCLSGAASTIEQEAKTLNPTGVTCSSDLSECQSWKQSVSKSLSSTPEHHG